MYIGPLARAGDNLFTSRRFSPVVQRLEGQVAKVCVWQSGNVAA